MVHALCDIVEREFPEARRFVIIDDTIILRSSAKAPDAAVRFDPVKRANQHVLCQVLVTLSASIVDFAGRFRAVPLLSFPVKGTPGRSRGPRRCSAPSPTTSRRFSWMRGT